ncbi:hypothetical protein BH11PLA1_BH11PLA1_19070 [soil metagenome]
MNTVKLSGAALVAAGILCASAGAQVVYTGGAPVPLPGAAPSPGFEFGVVQNALAPIIFVQPGVPTFGPNNVTGRNDIMVSPGGTYNSVNISTAFYLPPVQVAPIPLPIVRVQPPVGAFGGAFTSIVGTNINFSIRDNQPVGGGTVSASTATWTSTFTSPAGFQGTFSTFLAFNAVLSPGSEIALSLNTVSSATNGQVFTFPALVMAATGLGPGAPGGTVAVGGTGFAGGGGSRVMYFPLAGGGWAVRGLAVNNVAANIPAGVSFTAYNTFTGYADPAQFDTVGLTDLMNDPLLAGTDFFNGLTLPTGTILGGSSIPTPGALGLMAFGGLVACRRRRA